MDKRVWGLVVSVGLLAACGREPQPAPESQPATSAPAPVEAGDAPAAAPALAPVSLDDVIEHDPRYVVGISFPKDAGRYPGLARALSDYAQAARAELVQAVDGLEEAPRAPYELSLGFRSLLETDDVYAVAADGSLYTGGAHGLPLVARFVWLPRQDRMLTSENLLRTPDDWRGVADYVGEQLSAAAHTRAADEALEEEDRRRLLGTALKMIADGTEPSAENFSQFEPVRAADGRIGALRFVFPPYQVGPYADGVRTVDVPAQVLRPWLADDIRGLFSD